MNAYSNDYADGAEPSYEYLQKDMLDVEILGEHACDATLVKMARLARGLCFEAIDGKPTGIAFARAACDVCYNYCQSKGY